MDNRGLLVRLEAKSGSDEALETFLRSAVELVNRERGTTAWFAARFGRHEYGIIDVFPDDVEREAHLGGPVAAALMKQVGVLLQSPPEIHRFDVLAEKLPLAPPPTGIAKGLLLTFDAKAGHERSVEQFLVEARRLVDGEPNTTAWFAIRLDENRYGIFDVFPDAGGRFAHLTGQVPRELAKHAFQLLGSFPDMQLLNVVADKLPPPQPTVI